MASYMGLKDSILAAMAGGKLTPERVGLATSPSLTAPELKRKDVYLKNMANMINSGLYGGEKGQKGLAAAVYGAIASKMGVTNEVARREMARKELEDTAMMAVGFANPIGLVGGKLPKPLANAVPHIEQGALKYDNEILNIKNKIKDINTKIQNKESLHEIKIKYDVQKKAIWDDKNIAQEEQLKMVQGVNKKYQQERFDYLTSIGDEVKGMKNTKEELDQSLFNATYDKYLKLHGDEDIANSLANRETTKHRSRDISGYDEGLSGRAWDREAEGYTADKTLATRLKTSIATLKKIHSPTEWHHTGENYRATPYYSPQEQLYMREVINYKNKYNTNIEKAVEAIGDIGDFNADLPTVSNIWNKAHGVE